MTDSKPDRGVAGPRAQNGVKAGFGLLLPNLKVLPVNPDVHTVEGVITRLGGVADVLTANDREHVASGLFGTVTKVNRVRSVAVGGWQGRLQGNSL